ncbi:MAG: tetratricopeptide repeat protein [Hyphomicrobiales bacterium]|nr:tetratricopeptide repeat protein [Hyphomicrobiales bacterium]MCP5373641.1 tetratricopeptide repeat protein [Hyphomicrobiales bacterium]
MDTVATLLRAIGHFQAGELDAAEGLYRRVLESEPDQPDALHLLGLVMLQRGDAAGAVRAIAHAAAGRPDDSEILCNLGHARRTSGDFAGATEAFGRAAALDPGSLDAHHGLGVARHAGGDPAGAARAFERATELDPGDAGAWKNLGNARRAAGDADGARAAFERALALDPSYAQAHADLAALLREKRRFRAAAEAAGWALALDPDLVSAYRTRAHALAQMGRTDEAARVLADGAARTGDPGLAVRDALLVPVLPAGVDEITAGRARARDRLARLRAAGPRLDDPLRQVGVTNFYMAYQGLDDRDFQRDLAGLYLDACPGLAWTSPETPAGGGRLRLGIASNYLYPGHTIAKLCAGLVAHLPRDRVEVVLIRPGAGDDPIGRAADAVVALPPDLARARQAVAAARLDALLYTDIGMDPLTYFLAFARLAPVQMVTWGHPVTTGIPGLDLFLSTTDLDGAADQASYTETLARLPVLPVHYARPAPPDPARNRAALGLPEGRRLYVCTQTLFKIHPDFDAAVAAILRRDPDGVAVFIAGNMPALAERFRDRLARAHPDIVDRLLFLDYLPQADFTALCAAADVLLDTFHFSGGNTSFEAFAAGTPVVTLPSGFLRGRFTAGLYAKMGIADLIAGTPEIYVDLALRAARDRDWNRHLRDRILAAGPHLFEDRAAVASFADFLVDTARGRPAKARRAKARRA